MLDYTGYVILKQILAKIPQGNISPYDEVELNHYGLDITKPELISEKLTQWEISHPDDVKFYQWDNDIDIRNIILEKRLTAGTFLLLKSEPETVKILQKGYNFPITGRATDLILSIADEDRDIMTRNAT